MGRVDGEGALSDGGFEARDCPWKSFAMLLRSIFVTAEGVEGGGGAEVVAGEGSEEGFEGV